MGGFSQFESSHLGWIHVPLADPEVKGWQPGNSSCRPRRRGRGGLFLGHSLSDLDLQDEHASSQRRPLRNNRVDLLPAATR